MKLRLLKSACAAVALSMPLTLAAQSVAGQSAASQQAVPATQNAVLVADSLKVEGRNVLIARGNVEVFHQGRRLRASEITYNRKEDRLNITGPITLEDEDGVVILAGSAELDSRFENGLMLGARMVLDQRVQLAANELNRIGGRYTQLYKVAATSCRVCETGRPPLWQIRAKRTTHDNEAKQLYFDQAQVRILDVPVLWLPRLRLPDPTLKRATGFLMPSLRQNSQLGLGVRVPYFIRMGDHRDLTLTPFVSANTRTLEWRYRQAFHNGGLTFEGAVSDDDIKAGTRGYVFGNGRFDLARGFKLDLQIEAVTDDAYLLDYGFSSKDRLRSEVAVSRVTQDEFIATRLTAHQSLREGDINSQLPTTVANGLYERRFRPAGIGGVVTLSAAAAAYHRYSSDDIVGRDVARTNVSAHWQRDWTLPLGLRATHVFGVRGDAFHLAQDSTSPRQQGQLTPEAQLVLRWPFQKTTANGVTHLLEPVAMLGWAGGSNDNIPNEDSTRSEFDEGNLLSLSRFTGESRRERGGQSAIGLRWVRQGAQWGSDLTLGRVYRDAAEADFSATSGLSGKVSDVLIAGQLRNAQGFTLGARTLLDAGLSANKAEARVAWQRKDFGLMASYVWLGRDPGEDRADVISEWVLDGSYRFARHWTGATRWRYDVAGDKLAEARLGVNYRNECVDLNLSLSRRFTSSTNVDASTSVDFTVNLTGFSTGKTDSSYTRSCRN
ncbi:LPS-assembly protein LptD [Thalassovita mediterranea]|jgi:LPS-assembly protein|uniref:LPS-assembly protein LptD n=1 Tax=Thalassovita mediterranea TaxID=340021 RepID=A0A0P1GM38_9RHOB|nr:LPS assembly protein LptD [Thalassovita mediterranea]CUH83230.1 Organic solvent tolerance protein [Thalassovita mediterranea]SIS33566.1 LPS-assembly protein [Thalassovita mediterranea]